MNILDEANKIVNERSEEKTREYGSFSEGMKRAAKILSSLRGKEFDAHDMYAAMIALKFSRQSFNFKTDNLLDAVAYMGAWENYIQEEKAKEQTELKPVPFSDPLMEYLKSMSSAMQDFIYNPEKRNTHTEGSFNPQNPYNVSEEELLNFKENVENELFEPTVKSINEMSTAEAFKQMDKTLSEINEKYELQTKYVEYLAKMLDESISYSEYLAEGMQRVSNEVNGIKTSIPEVNFSSVENLVKSFTPPIPPDQEYKM